MTSIESIILEAPDPAATEHFYVAQPSIVDSLIGAAVDAGARTFKSANKSFWGYGGVVQAPDGAIWKIATSAKKNTGPATREISDVIVGAGEPFTDPDGFAWEATSTTGADNARAL